MKKQIVMIAALLIVLSSAVFANEGENSNSKTLIEVKEAESNLFNLVYKSTNSEKVSIRIVDENNRVIFSELIKNHESFVRPYNLSKLPEGTYTLKVVDANGSRSHELRNYHTNNTANVQSIVQFNAFEANRYVLKIANADQQRAIINIYNQNKDLVYSKAEHVNGTYAKIYNLKNVNTGLVEVQVNGTTNTFKF